MPLILRDLRNLHIHVIPRLVVEVVRLLDHQATHLRRKHVYFSDVDVAVLGQFEESRSVDPLQQVERGGRDKEHPEDWPVEDEEYPEADAHRVGPIEHLQRGESTSTSTNGGIAWVQGYTYYR
ncbi:hypothetical protein NP493_479g01031 [Ridgeia piscesae]|uniref:Uncharacterized protein n=1 Tax=Ridgeia piscesae TaxID=27915 RepID=A0AAD9KYI1_RIDPI|nr:hypothetical protein NP493_479g01031 [Ridgeia piscesae]